jgi:hypothetical protein
MNFIEQKKKNAKMGMADTLSVFFAIEILQKCNVEKAHATWTIVSYASNNTRQKGETVGMSYPYGFSVPSPCPPNYCYPTPSPYYYGGSGVWYSVFIVLFILLLIFGAYWYYSGC